jgi:hypothetical protein
MSMPQFDKSDATVDDVRMEAATQGYSLGPWLIPDPEVDE